MYVYLYTHIERYVYSICIYLIYIHIYIIHVCIYIYNSIQVFIKKLFNCTRSVTVKCNVAHCFPQEEGEKNASVKINYYNQDVSKKIQQNVNFSD